MTNGTNRAMGMGLSFLTGCLVGGVAGVLYAPQSGNRTRRQLSNFAEDMKEKAGELAEDMRQKTGELAKDATGAVERVIECSRNLVNA